MFRSCPHVLVAVLLALQPACTAALTAEDMQGVYESVDGTGNTCARNPATLTIYRAPDHVSFDWPQPMAIYDGSTRTGVTYDLLEERPDALVLRLEGDARRTEAGAPVIWLLRPTTTPAGFCWGRTDWPLIRCESAFRRCADAAPTS